MAHAASIPRKHFKDLLVWQKAMQLVRNVYELTARFPQAERYSLSDQMRRAAVSVPSNIAEGQSHQSSGDFIRFLRHARASLAELETQILIARDLKYVDDAAVAPVLSKVDEISRMLSGLLRSLGEQ